MIETRRLKNVVIFIQTILFLLAPHSLINFEIQKYKKEPKFDGVYSRNNPLKIKHVM